MSAHLVINLAAGETFWFRWIEVNDTGNDYGLAIDTFSIQFTPVPEPGTVLGVGAGALALGGFVRRKWREWATTDTTA